MTFAEAVDVIDFWYRRGEPRITVSDAVFAAFGSGLVILFRRYRYDSDHRTIRTRRQLAYKTSIVQPMDDDPR